MEDKRYDPYTGYEIKDEESTQEYHTQMMIHTGDIVMKMIT